MIKNLHWSSRKVPVTLVGFSWKLIFLDGYLKNNLNIKSHENPSSGSPVVPCRQTDRYKEANSRFSKFCGLAQIPRVHNPQRQVAFVNNFSFYFGGVLHFWVLSMQAASSYPSWHPEFWYSSLPRSNIYYSNVPFTAYSNVPFTAYSNVPFTAYSNVPLTLVPDCWLKVSIRKVLRPAISAQVLLGFPVSVYKRMLRWFPKTPSCYCMLLMQPPRFKYIRSLIYICVHVCNRCHRASAQLQ